MIEKLKDNFFIRNNSFLFLSIFFIVIAFLNFDNIFLGMAEDTDSRALVQSFVNNNSDNYEPSRALGVPLYEIIGKRVFALGGINALNFYSYFLWICLFFVVIEIFKLLKLENKLFFSLSFSLHPLIISSSTIPLETIQSVLFSALVLFFSIRYLFDQRNFFLFLSLVFSILATLTRPDNVFIVFTIFCLFIYRKEINKNILITAFLYVFFISVIYIYEFNFLENFASTASEFKVSGADFIRLLLGPIYLLGIFSIGLLALLKFKTFQNLFCEQSPTSKDNFLRQLFFLATVIFLIRWTMLPDEIEYLLNYFLIFIIYSAFFFKKLFLVLLTISISSQFFFVPYLFEKEIKINDKVIEYSYILDPGLTEGIIQQNNQIRKSNIKAQSIDFLKKIEFKPPLEINHVEFPPYLNAIILNKNFFLTGPVGLAQLSGKFKSYIDKNNLYLCSTEIIPNRGWRVFQKAKFIESNNPIICKAI